MSLEWLLGIRLGGLPRWTTIPVLALGLLIGRALLPADIAHTGKFTLVAVALVECSALLLAVVNIRKIMRGMRAGKRAGSDGFDALETALLARAPSAPGLVSYVRLTALTNLRRRDRPRRSGSLGTTGSSCS